MIVFLVFVAALLFYVIYRIARVLYLNRKRINELSSYARKNGWEFTTEAVRNLRTQHPQFRVFNKGWDQYASNTIRGSFVAHGTEWSFLAGDYHYSDKSWHLGTSPTGNNVFSYLLLETPFSSMPDISIRHEKRFDNMISKDIDFESIEFNNKFYVECSSKRFAYDLVNPLMIDFLIRTEHHPLEIKAGYCLIFGKKEKWSVKEFKSKIKWMSEFCNRWPRYLHNAEKKSPSRMST